MQRLVFPALSALALVVAAPALAQASDEETVDIPGDGEIGSGGEEFEFLTEEEEVMAAFEAEMEAAFSIFGELFEAEPLTAEQEALLPLANQMTDYIMPEGTFGTIMQDTMKPMMNAIMGSAAGNPRLRVAVLTGVDFDALEKISDDDAAELLTIFDPDFTKKTEKMGDVAADMVSQLFAALEPAYREGYSRALVTRFQDAEMRELVAFFETPTGGKFARASFDIQYDPQMLGVMEQMGPAMMQVMPGMMEQVTELEAQFAQERKFGDLSEAQRNRAASLLDKSVAELEALQPEETEEALQEDASLFEEA